MGPLDPPISDIERALFGEALEADAPGEPLQHAETSSVKPGPLPTHLLERVRQGLAADRRFADLPVGPGQIRMVAAIPGGRTLARPVGVLLDRPLADGTWRGWVASGEPDYATDRDLVLDERDEPFDPLASMVQAWNPVTVRLQPNARTAAVMGEKRLRVVRALEESAAGGAKARPGLVAAAEIADELALIGTPLGGLGDPRAEYQRLYAQWGEELSTFSMRKASGIAAARPWFWHPAFGAAVALLVVVQLGVIAVLWNPDAEYSGTRQISPVNAGPRLRVHFNPDASQRDVHKALRSMNAQVVAGPDEGGAFVVQLQSGADPEKAAAALRAVPGLVDAIEQVGDAKRK